MTTKRSSKNQARRNRVPRNSLLAKPIDDCSLRECLRLHAFYTEALGYLGVNSGATLRRLPPRKKPCHRAMSGGMSRAA
jgi:hypothetical protein